MHLFNRFIAGAALVSIVTTLTSTSSNAQSKARGGDEGAIAGAGIPLLTTERVVGTGLIRPIFVTHAPGDATRLFIIEKRGLIRVLNLATTPPTLLAVPFLDIDSQCAGGTTQGSEQGLLGLAFHPNYQQNGVFYVYYTATTFANTIARFQVSADPNVAVGSNTPGSIVLQIADTESNHNGGWISFKPGDTEGYLYVATGDGGGGNDQHGTIGNGQNLSVIGGGVNVHALLGKILRLDVDGLDNIPGNADDDSLPADATRNYSIPVNNPFVGITGEDEIWAYGLRNPFRCSFDRATGDLYIGDVGQNAWEEVNIEPSNSPGGRNYGWRCMEGNNCTGLTGCTCNVGCGAGLLVCPVQQYFHDGTVCSITGGYVYRGTRMPALQGTYFYADYNCSIPGSAPIWSFKYVGGLVTNFQSRTAELAPGSGFIIDTLTSFGEDLNGEIYICDQEGGEIFKIIPRPCLADVNGNGTRDVADLLSVITSWGPCAAPPATCPADIIVNGSVDVADLLAVISNWGACP